MKPTLAREIPVGEEQEPGPMLVEFWALAQEWSWAGDVVAVFPERAFGGYVDTLTCYSHIGEHGGIGTLILERRGIRLCLRCAFEEDPDLIRALRLRYEPGELSPCPHQIGKESSEDD